MLLLDTHAVLWLDMGIELSPGAQDAIDSARGEDGVLVSAVSAWEIGTLVRKGRIRLDIPPGDWMARLLRGIGLRPVALSMEAAVAASTLPEPLHGDPADRLLIAMARELDVPLVTRDGLIHRYAQETGAVRVIAC